VWVIAEVLARVSLIHLGGPHGGVSRGCNERASKKMKTIRMAHNLVRAFPIGPLTTASSTYFVLVDAPVIHAPALDDSTVGGVRQRSPPHATRRRCSNHVGGCAVGLASRNWGGSARLDLQL
jgi:hypothetical protein